MSKLSELVEELQEELAETKNDLASVEEKYELLENDFEMYKEEMQNTIKEMHRNIHDLYRSMETIHAEIAPAIRGKSFISSREQYSIAGHTGTLSNPRVSPPEKIFDPNTMTYIIR